MTHRMSSDLSGMTLNARYLVLMKIGAGGFATVYRARDARLGNNVAIKVLHPEHTRNIADLDRFRNEARLAGVINDEHFVKVTDFFQEGERFCFVMEHLEGVTLREELQRLPGKIMAWPRAFKLARQLCGGLSAAHASGLIHRDLKPENIFLKNGVGEQVKLLDLGVAKVLEDHNWSGLCKNLSNTGDIIGSPCYIAPEQVRGERGLDVRVDIYALGVVLYEMVTGRVPFRGQTAFETLEHHVRSEPKRPNSLVPELNLPRPIEDLILRALKKRPQDRYRSAQDMDAALRNALANRSDPRGMRAVQHMYQVPMDPVGRGGAAPGETQTTVVLEIEEPTTAKQIKPAVPSVAPPVVKLPPPGPASVWPIQPGDTDVTPAPHRARGTTPKAQGSPTLLDISLEVAPALLPEPRSVPTVKPLQVRTMVMLGSFAAASLIATCSVGTVLAMAIKPSGTRPVENIPEVWSEPSEPQAALPVEVIGTSPKQEEEGEGDEAETIAKVGDPTALVEPKRIVVRTSKLPVAPKPPRVGKPRPVTMDSIARRAAAMIKKECVIDKFAGSTEGKASIQFTVDMTTGKVKQLWSVGPVPTLADRACVMRIAHALVTDFTGAVDLRPIFVYSFPVVR